MANEARKAIPIQRVRLQFNDDKALNSLSAVERINTHLFLGSDESESLERLTLDGKGGYGDHRSFKVGDNIPPPPIKTEKKDDKEKKQEIDIEGLSRDGNFLWLVGSHSLKRERPKPDDDGQKMIEKLATVKPEPTRYVLGRIPLITGQAAGEVSLPTKSDATPDSPDGPQAAYLPYSARGNTLIDALAGDAHIGPFLPQVDLHSDRIGLSIPSKDNGLDIEGLAARDNHLFIGLRGPVLRGWAIVLELKASADPPKLELHKIGPNDRRYRKHLLRLDGLGVRDLCWRGNDLLILAGPTMDLDGPVRLYRWRNAADLKGETVTPREQIELLFELPHGEGDDHAEGMTIIDDGDSTPLLLVVYDSPAKMRKAGDTAVYADLFALPN